MEIQISKTSAIVKSGKYEGLDVTRQIRELYRSGNGKIWENVVRSSTDVRTLRAEAAQDLLELLEDSYA